MGKKTKTIVLDENKVIAFFEGIIPYDRTVLNDFLKQCSVVSKTIPPEQDFVDYGLMLFKQLGKNPTEYDYSLRAKYFQWKEDGWIDGYGQPIKNWKTKLANTLASLKPIRQERNNTDNLMNKLLSNGIPDFK
jgi:hypothetical protein